MPRSRYAVAFLVVLAVLRIAATLRTFSATADEATHVGAGLELYQFHRYQLQRVNPPAARAVLGILPALGGMRFDRQGDYGAQLHSVFYGPGGSYERKMFLSRIGNGLFVILAALAIFLYVRQESDELTAVVAVFLFTFEPVILGHGGLATNDMAATAGLAVALLTFARWLRQPTLARAALLAAAWAFAILCKFSNLPFVPLACLAIGAARLIADRENRATILRRAATLLVVPILTPLGIWAGYAFTVGTLGDLQPVHGAFGPRVEQFIRSRPSMPIPAPDFFFGLGHIRLLDSYGHLSYFRGEASTEGWALYFPATILLKTTLVVILLLAAGAWFGWQTPRLRRLWIESTAVALLLLAFSMRSRLDLGIRYVLPLFVPLTIAAAAGATAMIRSRRAPMFACALLLAWHAATSIGAHPDYFPYFNFLAGRDPSLILIDSNLDWGQDVLRLRREIRRARVDRIGLSLMSTADFDALGFPPHHDLNAFSRASGWFAVSDHMLRMDEAFIGGWRWLGDAKFVRVGKSIRLYHLPPKSRPM
jgi:4-amino-4-deoxy-L-arabinose transferase-like glycosyltransferase